ncbi:hypothetical protein C6503_01965 [Candidatus Poribacteria bacterium]|nr:MAG: hypothetical protein C6503_01965 [Candidatus Poribacteria bacterium]
MFAMMGFHFGQQAFTSLTVLIVLSIMFVSDITAEEEYATLSGRVITAEGEPVAGASIMLQISTAPTDSEGRFTFTKITASQTRFSILRNPMSKSGPSQPSNTKVRAIKFGKVTFYPLVLHDSSRSATFAIEPGADITDVEVIMERQLIVIVRGKIIFKNGEPLADTSLKIKIDQLDLDGTDGYGFNRSFQTDADGNFVYATYTPGIYVLSIDHHGLSAASEPFIIEESEPHETVVLTLNGNSTDLSVSPPEQPKKQRLYHPSYISDTPGVWMINPTNGHAYKWIECEDREDAQIQAAAEEAHLVTITTEAEQIWLEAVFRTGPYWIGLTDIVKEGEWQWETGEPVIYANWKENDEDHRFLHEPSAFQKFLGFKNEDRFREEDDMKDYVIMSDFAWGGVRGKWKTVHHTEEARMAILEKDGM